MPHQGRHRNLPATRLRAAHRTLAFKTILAPLPYLRELTAPERTARANLHLGVTLAFVAGAFNAGGFLAIGQYTSHMTGVVSSVADQIVLAQWDLVIAGVLSLLAFVAGAASTAILVNYARRNHHGAAGPYAVPLLIEAALLLVFGLVGSRLQSHELISISLTAVLLCYAMGLQNALVTKISNAEIRTTHVTGLVTDIGIELGKSLYWNQSAARSAAQAAQAARGVAGTATSPAPLPGPARIQANRRKLRVHLSLVGAFFVGGVTGATGFKLVGFIAALPLAALLVVIAAAPLLATGEAAQRPSTRI